MTDTLTSVIELAVGTASLGAGVAAWRSGGGDLLAASYDGTRGHPLLVARPAWSDVPDEGLRAREPVLVPCDDLRAPGDVDRPDDLPGRLREGES